MRVAVLYVLVCLLALPSAAPAARYPRKATLRDGVLFFDRKPRFLLSTDYPYYRDDAALWGRRLDQIKAAGINVVTFYTPWRHHQPMQDMAPDFTGRTQANRNVVGFIREIRARGMRAVVKPGPFVHAELNYGGLPDWVNPTRNPAIRPDADSLGNPTFWLITQDMLPGFFDPTFRRLTDAYMKAVADQVIRPFEPPRGPVVAVQVLNERIFSDSGAVLSAAAFTAGGVSASGYSAPRIADWGRGSPPRLWARPAGLAAAEPYVSWGLHHGKDYRDATEAMIAALRPLRVPVYLNPNPDFLPVPLPNAPGDHVISQGEDWLIRTEADHRGERYGIGNTNWVGVVMKRPRAYFQYVHMATRFRGPNLEEDWGFGKIYDPVYTRAQASVFQSVAYPAWGATGLNVYTGVSTTWFENDPALDNYRKKPAPGGPTLVTDPSSHSPYPDAAPIRPDNSRGPTYPAARQLARLWRRVGPSLVRSRPPRNIAWGIYPPYAAAGAWEPQDADWQALGLVGAPHAVYKGSEGFLWSAIETDTQAGQVHLPTATVRDLRRWRAIVLAGSRWMDLETQRKLVEYVRRGGTLFLTGDLPVLGADLRSPQRALVDALLPGVGLRVRRLVAPVEVSAFGGRWRAADAVSTVTASGAATIMGRLPDGAPVALHRRVGRGNVVFAGWQPWSAPDRDSAQYDGSRELAERVVRIFARPTREAAHPSPLVEVNTWRHGRRRLHVFVLNREPRPQTVRAAGVTVRVAGHGVAEVMLDRRRLVAAYVDGANDLEPERSVAPLVRVKGRRVSASGPADLLVLGRRKSIEYARPGTRVRDVRRRGRPR